MIREEVQSPTWHGMKVRNLKQLQLVCARLLVEVMSREVALTQG